MKKILLSLSLVIFGALFVASTLPAPVHAAGDDACQARSLVFLNPWTSVLPCVNGAPAITSLADVTKLIFWGVDSLFKVSSLLAVFWLMWGGVKLMKAQGNPGEITEGRNTIMQAVIGLVICIMAVAIVNFVLGIF